MDRIKIIKILERIFLILAVLAVVVATVWSPPSKAAEADEEKELGLWVEVQGVSGGRPARAIVWFERDVTEKFGFFAFVWKESDGYREIIAGPTWKPFEGAQVGCGIGREIMRVEGSGSRRSCFAEVALGKANFYTAVERGGFSGPWKKVTATYAVTESFGFGLMHETGLGNGPRVERNVRKNIQVWAALLRGNVPNLETEIEEKKTSLMVVFNISF